MNTPPNFMGEVRTDPGNRKDSSTTRLRRRLALLAVAGVCALGSGVTVRGALPEFRQNMQPLEAARAMSAQSAVSEMLVFEDIPIVTASRYEQKSSEAPANVIVITGEEIQRYGYRTLGEALQTLPGLYVNDDRTYTYVGVRGFGREGDFNSRIQLLLNGHPMADTNFDYAPMGEDLGIDMSLIDRIEVVYGPGSALYGSNALFATINILTRKPSGPRSTEMELEGGSFGYGKLELRHTGEVAGWEIGLGVSALNVNGDELFFEEFDALGMNGGVTKKSDFENAYQIFATGQKGPFTIQAFGIYRDVGLPTAAYGVTFNDEGNQVADTHWFLELKYEKKLRDDLNLSIRTSYDDVRYWGTYRYDDGFGTIIDNIDISRDKFFIEEVQLDYTHSAKHRFTFGQGFQRNMEVRMENFDVDPHFRYADVDQSFNEYSFYAQHVYASTNGVQLTSGVRFDDYSSFGSAVSPRLAFVYGPSSRWNVKLMAAKAFRAPNAFELFYDDGFTLGAQELDPEVLTSYELGFDSNLNSRLQFRLALYHNRIRDLINLVEISPGVFQFANLDRVENLGGEISLRARFANGLSGYLSYARVDAEDGDGNELTNYSPNMAKAGVSVPFGRKDWRLSVNMQFYDDRLLLDGSRGPDVFLTNLTLQVPLFHSNARLSASIYNLLDRDYGWPAREEHDPLILIPQDGRTFALRLGWKF
ncbi:MAG: TonB-dependent receptor [Acidobacteria bacterium]|nr:TonB-dependent receptor [Acidobacteriota bacterium]